MSGTKAHTIGDSLRRIMYEENITGVMLADWAGVHPNTVYNWLRGKCPYADTLFKVARVLNRPMEVFFEIEEE